MRKKTLRDRLLIVFVQRGTMDGPELFYRFMRFCPDDMRILREELTRLVDENILSMKAVIRDGDIRVPEYTLVKPS